MSAQPELSPLPARSAERPRLVVLVDNAVIGDSRVQKCSIAAAEAGWDVILIGRAQEEIPDEFRLGDVQVRRIAAPYALLSHRTRMPRSRWRYPFAYVNLEQSVARRRLLEASSRDLEARRQLAAERIAALSAGGGLPGRLKVAGIRAAVASRDLRYTLRYYWHGGRWLQFTWAVERAKQPHGVLTWLNLELRALLGGRRVWRSFDPVLWDLELAYGPVIDELQPDLIHANDFRMSGVALRAAARARAAGRTLQVVYDVHEYVPGVLARSRRWQLANQAHEREFIGQADAVLTVSERLAHMLQDRYRLPRLPRVVLNAPQFDPAAPAPRGGIRADCGLGPDVPLLVYSGGSAEQRGLMTMIEALPELPGVHVAIVAARNAFAESLLARAAQLDAADRVHLLPYVPQDQVVPYLASASIGVIPIHHLPNHEIALITKYFEYAHAGLPIVVSDVDTMGRQTRELGNGEVFVAKDVPDYVRAVRAVLADRDRYTRPYVEHPDLMRAWSWPRQAEVLTELYTEVTGLRPEPRTVPADAASGSGAAEGAPDGDRRATASAS